MGDITQVLVNWSNATKNSKNQVFDALYNELRRIAQLQLQGGGARRVDLQPTALVHEAYFKLIDQDRMDLNGRCHFLALAGRVMRQILLDEVRRARAQKRDNALQTRLTGDIDAMNMALDDLLELNDALEALGDIDAQYVAIVDARLFAGLTIEETAAALGVSAATVKRKWKVARAWIAERLDANDRSDAQSD